MILFRKHFSMIARRSLSVLLRAGVALALVCHPDTTPPAAAAARQIVLVTVPDARKHAATLRGLTRTDGGWKTTLAPMPARIGERGLAAPGQKREGDLKTPSGRFALATAFGRAPSPPSGCALPYRQATERDFWVDAPHSPAYNTWVHGSKPPVSAETLLREDGLYDYALVVEYNIRPVVPGKGSAIFLHIWRTDATPTAGCVAVSRSDILRLLRWLRPDAAPELHIRERP